MKYPVAVWNTDGAYTGEIPNLPGVVTEADSIEELEASDQRSSRSVDGSRAGLREGNSRTYLYRVLSRSHGV